MFFGSQRSPQLPRLSRRCHPSGDGHLPEKIAAFKALAWGRRKASHGM